MGRLRFITELQVVRNRNNTRRRELTQKHLSIFYKRQRAPVITGNVVQTRSDRSVDQNIASCFFKIRKESFQSYALQFNRRTRSTAQRQPRIILQCWERGEKSGVDRLSQQTSKLILVKGFRGADGPVELICSICCSNLNGRVFQEIRIQPIRRRSFDQIMANKLVGKPCEQTFGPFT